MVDNFFSVLLITCFSIFSVSCSQQSESPPVDLILDTDISSDADDVGAVAVLHRLADEGNVNILGMMLSSGDPWSYGCLRTLNRHFKRPDIPIGLVSVKNPVLHKSYYTRAIAELSDTIAPNTVKTDAVTLYRQLLADAEENSVVIVTVGYLTNLKKLLESGENDHSGLKGWLLVKKKVKLLVVMGGDYPKGKEWNFYQDPEAAGYVAEHWPTRIVFAGFTLGKDIITGRKLADFPVSNPVRVSYELHNKLKGRPSWDQLAVIFAGLPDTENKRFFAVSEPGVNVVSQNGENRWESNPYGKHYYLNLVSGKRDMGEVIEQMMLGN